MNRTILLLILMALLPGSNGCKPLMGISSSSFLSRFSLGELMKRNQSPAAILCVKGGMGGGENSIGSASRKQSSIRKSSSFACQIGSAAFDESGLMASLKTDLENELTGSGARIIGQGSSGPAGFYLEYSEGDIHGRINIEGKRARDYYSLEASLDEKREGR